MLVFEMAEKGVLMDIDLDKAAQPYSEEECRVCFRQMILGIEYRKSTRAISSAVLTQIFHPS